MIKFGVEIYSLIYPKWSKIRFKISDQGKFLFILNPALTPGKLPDGVKPGIIPPGTKIFDYSEDKECIMSLSMSECLKIVDFAKTQSLMETVDIIHKHNGESKVIKFSWGTGKSNEIELCNINYTKTSRDNSTQKIYIPVPFDGIREIVTILNSYLTNFVLLKTVCMAEILALNESKGTKKAYKKTAYELKTKPNVDLSDWDEEANTEIKLETEDY
jgi:hypothetical protein